MEVAHCKPLHSKHSSTFSNHALGFLHEGFSRDAASQRVPVTLFTLARVKNFGCEPNDTRLTDGKSACALFMQAFAEEQEGSSRLFAYLRQEHHGIGGNLESSKRQHGHRTQHLVLLSKEKHWVVGHRSCNQKALGCWQTATNKKLLSYTHISRYLTIIHHVSSEF